MLTRVWGVRGITEQILPGGQTKFRAHYDFTFDFTTNLTFNSSSTQLRLTWTWIFSVSLALHSCQCHSWALPSSNFGTARGRKSQPERPFFFIIVLALCKTLEKKIPSR
jgi:hypothetical protein